jgi:limonene-1,2-epoxide hydrolase
MPSREIVEAFAKQLEDGDFVGAIEHFYAPDAATYENQAEPMIGRDKLAAKERGVLAVFKEVRLCASGRASSKETMSPRAGDSASPMPKA